MPSVDLHTIRRALKNPRVVVRVVIGSLLLADLVTAVLVFQPWTGSASDLDREVASLTQKLRQARAAVERLRTTASKVAAARTDGDKFMDAYLLSRRTLSSSLVDELDHMARTSGIKQKDVSFNFEAIEGSDTLNKATITAGYEGTYADLIQFLNALDRSPRLLVIESLNASPQQAGLTLNVTLKLNAIVREGGAAPAEAVAAGDKEEPAAAQQSAAQQTAVVAQGGAR